MNLFRSVPKMDIQIPLASSGAYNYAHSYIMVLIVDGILHQDITYVLQWQSQKHRCHGFRDTAKVL